MYGQRGRVSDDNHYEEKITSSLKELKEDYCQQQAIKLLRATWDHWAEQQTDAKLIQDVWKAWTNSLHDTIRGEM